MKTSKNTLWDDDTNLVSNDMDIRSKSNARQTNANGNISPISIIRHAR